ncbi:DUF3696 domain-containing protein [Burkholderia sp. Bp9012]|uniref:AAA family ATPase n=1 Tax=Burkholderia sp. Bp9012 TaxID=2184562 RepID=UPI000F5AA49D|nr:DUF3696 domain-containing protein [Burkholderia sp. Bp9012]RQR72257.1 DUF3696 domain-containing protein [Burkholderia sp. Bp9012]
MFRQLTLTNFKAHRTTNVALAPVTLLSGLNSTGKSSVLQSILLIEQNCDRYASDFLKLNGDWVRLGTGSDIHFEGAQTSELKLLLTGDEGLRYEIEAESQTDGRIRITSKKSEPSAARLFPQYLSAERIGPRTSFPTGEDEVRIKAGYLGTRGEYTFQYLAEIVSDVALPNPRLRHPEAISDDLFHNIEKWMGEISPGVRLEALPMKQADITVPSFYYSGSRKHRPTNVGFGVTYSLPIVVAILNARPHSLVLMENPEAHLHPEGQIALARLMARAAEDVQFIVESHSDHILNGLCVAVACDGVPPERMALNYFQRSALEAEVKRIDILPNGRLSEWPSGFFDQNQAALMKIMRAQRRQQ